MVPLLGYHVSNNSNDCDYLICIGKGTLAIESYIKGRMIFMVNDSKQATLYVRDHSKHNVARVKGLWNLSFPVVYTIKTRTNHLSYIYVFVYLYININICKHKSRYVIENMLLRWYFASGTLNDLNECIPICRHRRVNGRFVGRYSPLRVRCCHC